MKAREVISCLDMYAPLSLAAPWDNSGWQVGSQDMDVTGVWVTLDVTEEVLVEAQDHQANLIIAHHPLIFEPVRSLDTDSYQGRLLRALLVENMGLYIAHSNLDVVEGGVNTALAEALQLKGLRPLQPLSTSLSGSGWPGWGAIGTLTLAVDTEHLVAKARQSLQTPEVRVTRGGREPHRLIAVCGGSGAQFTSEAWRIGATAYVTGEVKYHEAQEAARAGLTVLEVGHFYSERPVLIRLAEYLRSWSSLATGISQVVTSPFDPW